MADNTTLNSGTGGDVIRDIDRGAGYKTQVVAIDLGGASTNAENLATNYVPTAKTEDSGLYKAIKLNEDEEVLVEAPGVVQELQEIKLILQNIEFILEATFK